MNCRASSERLIEFLLELKLYISEDLAGSANEKAGMRGHSLLGMQSLAKELLLLLTRFQDDESSGRGSLLCCSAESYDSRSD